MEPHTHIEKNRRQCIYFLMVIMAGGIARGHVCTTAMVTATATIELYKMTAKGLTETCNLDL